MAVLQLVIDGGAGAGVLGDFNLDNVADCDDLAAILDAIDNEEDPFDDYIIGDAEYRIELDADLDGDNDADDWNIIYGLLQPADVNRDGEVNSVDFVQYLNLYNAQDPAADMNGDGQVNSVDFVIYLNYYNNPC
ncbi:MAG TPA: GC-type dockerin domain-anchored protein [Phycisphaerales bacterium]|nr:GC-type dockerin domain-anchored protein [Phycisphaerales bacterium]